MREIIGVATVGGVGHETLNDSIKKYNEGVNDLFPTSHLRHILPRPLNIPYTSYDYNIGKYSTYPFFQLGHQMFRLVDGKRHDGIKMEKCVIVTNVPLFCYSTNAGVFGEAEVSGSVAVLSIHGIATRHKDLFTLRLLKEFHFLIGAMYGLVNCKDPTCVMHSCQELSGLDGKGMHLCERCVERLLGSV